MKINSEKLVTIKRFIQPLDAQLAKAQLESCDIPAFVQDQHMVGMNVWYSHAVGGVKLKVYESDLEIAEKILNETENIEKVEVETDVCPSCDSPDIEYYKEANMLKRGVFTFASFFLSGVPWVFKSKSYRCQACGHVWK